MRQECGLETRIVIDTQGIDHAIRTLDHSLHSTHKLATIPKIPDSPDGERARVSWNEEVPHGVEPPVLLEPKRNGESRSDDRSVVLTFSPCLVSDPIS